MIPCWTLYIKTRRGYEIFDQLDQAEYPLRRHAEAYAKDFAEGLRQTEELEETPRTAVIPDLRVEA